MFWDAPAKSDKTNLDTASPFPAESRSRLKIGLALGGGAARGWAHIGVLKELLKGGVVPDVIAGTSIGAVVGGCYAASKLDELEAFARALTKRRVMGLMDFHIAGSGLVSGERLRRILNRDLGECRIEALPLRFAAIATEVGTGHEIWLRRGLLVEAMRASYALPGIFDPVKIGGRWLMDGALVNPVPVTAARALGADIVICVNLNGDIRLRGTIIQSNDGEMADEVVEAVIDTPRRGGFFAPVRDMADKMLDWRRRPAQGPRLASVMLDAFNITQDRIARSKLAGDPPDITISPKLSSIGLFEFHRAEEALEAGRQAGRHALKDIRELLEEVSRLNIRSQSGM